jgi:hypothetical protein
MKYYVSVGYTKSDNKIKFKYIDEYIVTASKDYNKADYKIRQYLTARYAIAEQIVDIRICPIDLFEKFTIK